MSAAARAALGEESEDESEFVGFGVQPGEPLKKRQALAPVDNLPITADERSKLVSKAMRYLVMMGNAGEPIKGTAFREAVLGEEYRKKQKVAKTVLDEAALNIENLFGYQLHQAPADHFTQSKFKDSYYLVNKIRDGAHCARVNATDGAATRGLLMVVLSFVYCSNYDNSNHKVAGGGWLGGAAALCLR